MDIRVAVGSISSYGLKPSDSLNRNNNAFKLRPCCSRKDSTQQNGNNDNKNDRNGDKFSTDWDKAWSSYRKQGKKKTLFSQFSDKYVSWNPRRFDFPLAEEIDPIKRTEKSNLMLWTSQTFTLGVGISIVSLLLIYTILAPIK